MLSDIVGMVCCRNEGGNVSDAVATLILASLLVCLDVGTGTPAPTTPTKESFKAFLGISERSDEEENSLSWQCIEDADS